MAKAKNGDKVRLHYTGKLGDETVFDSSDGREPLEFTLGEGKVICGFEEAVIGMCPGDMKTVDINPAKAYGPRRKELVAEIERGRIPGNDRLKVGEYVQLRQRNGGVIRAQVTELSDSTVTLDANHPLAGKLLKFEIRLLEIV